MRVITFNLRCVNDFNGNSIRKRAPRLKAIMELYNADIVGFQEVTPKWLEYLKRDFGDIYEIFNVYRRRINKESTPIMWKKNDFGCIDKGNFWLSDTPDKESFGWDVTGCYRICTWAALTEKKSGICFSFFNTHYGFGSRCQMASGNLIIDRVKAENEERSVLTGDFNMTPDKNGYKLLTSFFSDANACTARDMRATYHRYNQALNGAHIDYCFVTPKGIRPISSRLMDDTVDGKFPSDHYGVYTELEFI